MRRVLGAASEVKGCRQEVLPELHGLLPLLREGDGLFIKALPGARPRWRQMNTNSPLTLTAVTQTIQTMSGLRVGLLVPALSGSRMLEPNRPKDCQSRRKPEGMGWGRGWRQVMSRDWLLSWQHRDPQRWGGQRATMLGWTQTCFEGQVQNKGEPEAAGNMARSWASEQRKPEGVSPAQSALSQGPH